MSTVHEILCKLSLEGDVSISVSLYVIFASWTSLDNYVTLFPCTSKEDGDVSDSHHLVLLFLNTSAVPSSSI